MDGDGVEYVFIRTNSDTAPTITNNNSYTEGGKTIDYTMDEFRPMTSEGRATDDPTVLGIKPIPNIEKVISDMIEKYRAESLDIDDIEYEDADIQWAEYEEVREDETDSPNL